MMVKRLIAPMAAMAMSVSVLVMPAPALASSAAPHWLVSSVSSPSNFVPGDSSGRDVIHIVATNVGGAPTDGSPITLSATLPAGLTLDASGPQGQGPGHDRFIHAPVSCSAGPPVSCIDTEAASPGQTVVMEIPVDVSASAAGSITDVVSVAGGGAASASASASIKVSAVPAPFGAQIFESAMLNSDGSVDTQAGSHPYALDATFGLNSAYLPSGELGPSGSVKDIKVALPPGLIGDPHTTPQCSPELFLIDRRGETACPNDTVVGEIRIELGGFGSSRGFQYFPVFNIVPSPGLPAEFGFNILGSFPTFIDPSVRTGGDYGLSTTTPNIAQDVVIYGATLTFWGVPTDPSHDALRGSCLGPNGESLGSCPTNLPPKPLLTLPTSCSGPLVTGFSADSWQQPGVFPAASFTSENDFGAPAGLDGCNRLAFEPSILAAPDTSEGDTPAGLTAEITPSVGGLLDPEGLSPADLQNATVVLPAGVVINPGQAAGLQACEPGQDAQGVDGPPSCPAASKVGTVEVTTPLLADKLTGTVYVLQSNPPNLRLLVAASADGVQLNLVGDVHLDTVTGQLTTTFSGTPELPFSDFKLAFSGGAQAALVTPSACGVYTTASDFMPWSSPFEADVFPTGSFAVDSGPGGSACASPLPFSPALTAGATTDQAGGYTNFSLLLQRGDGQQRVSSLQFKTPQGLLGMISKVPLCGEPQAAQGTCPAASQIGHTVVTAGPGPYPLVVPGPGQPAAPIYLTGGYKGAPYGLSIAVPVIAGPFNLGTVVVRSAINVDPHTAQLTITTDPLPSILDGVPTDLRSINAVIDREGFMFNPTNCNPQAFSGTAFSTEGARAAISTHFQVGSCQSLKFKPAFKVSTAGKTSRANGASLDAKIVYPTGVLGANQASQQSNIASVKVDLPKQLPSRLTTLQKACTNAQFESNPAGCPAASLVGHATAVTPVLPVALSGPAYFVSHGGEAFPSLIIVLQGYGVTVDLVGTTFISHAGITSSTFKQVPDVPITTFDLTLPEGKYSALAANGTLCKSKLAMPTAFVGQNGAEIHQSTKISVTGCPKTKKATKRHRKTNKKGRGSRRADRG